MAKDVLLSQSDINEILKEKAEEVKQQMTTINRHAALAFYVSGSSGSYNRTGTFENLGKNPDEKISGKILTLTYTYSSRDLSVNQWKSPWGITYSGSPEWAFDTGFIHGVHGGPRPLSGYSKHITGWTWSGVGRSDPIFDMICEKVDAL